MVKRVLSSIAEQQLNKLIGRRIRALRQERRMSQARLGEPLGISFQQVQKIERGINRISAGRLVIVANVLGVSAAYFLEGLGD